jgi:hypothetical protein
MQTGQSGGVWPLSACDRNLKSEPSQMALSTLLGIERLKMARFKNKIKAGLSLNTHDQTGENTKSAPYRKLEYPERIRFEHMTGLT